MSKRTEVRTHLLAVGTGEAFGSELGNTAYLLRGSRPVLFDCGYQIPERLWKGELHGDLAAICLTHLHADHSFGVVPLLTRYWEERRELPLEIFGPRGTERFIKRIMDLGYPGMLAKLAFPIHFTEFEEGTPIRWNDLRLSVARTVHSVLNLTIRVDIPKCGYSFAVSGDGQITPETRALVRDVDLLLQEVYTLDEDIPTHANLVTIEEFAGKAPIGRIGVAHHARGAVSKVHRRVSSLARSDRRWVILKPGMELPLTRERVSC